MKFREAFFIMLFAVCAGIFQATVSPFLPEPWASFQPVILLLLSWILRNRQKQAMLFAVIAGFFLDIYSPSMGSIAMVRFLVLAVVLFLISKRILTNQSLYAAIGLDISARGSDWLMQAVYSVLTGFFSGAHVFRFPSFGRTLSSFAWDVGIIILVFLIRALFARRFVLPSMRPKSYG